MMHCTTLLQTWFKTHNTHTHCTLYAMLANATWKKPQLRSETNVCLWIVVLLQSTRSFLLIWKHNDLIMGNKDFHYFLTNIPQNIRIKFVYLWFVLQWWGWFFKLLVKIKIIIWILVQDWDRIPSNFWNGLTVFLLLYSMHLCTYWQS